MKYTYEIIKVDEAARVMEVVYTHPVHGSYHVGVRLPYADENLLTLVNSAAPLGIWKSMEKQVQIPPTGLRGEAKTETRSNNSSNEVLL